MTQPVDLNQIALALIAAAPGFVAACVAAAISWHNRTIAKDTNARTIETKTIINGRMEQLLAAASELAEIKGRQAAHTEMKLLKVETDKAVTEIIKGNNAIDRRA